MLHCWQTKAIKISSVTEHSFGLPCGLVVKNPPASAGDASSIPELERSPGEMATHSSILA